MNPFSNLLTQGTAALTGIASKGTAALTDIASKGTGAVNTAASQITDAVNTAASKGTGAVNTAASQITDAVNNAQITQLPAATSGQIQIPATSGQIQIPAAATGQTSGQTSGQTPSSQLQPGQTQSNTDPNKSDDNATEGFSWDKFFKWDNFFKWVKENGIIKAFFVFVLLIGVALVIYFLIPSSKQKKPKKEGFFDDEEDPEEKKEQNSNHVKIDEVERQLQDRITNINTNLTALKNRIDNADIVKNNKPTNLAIAIQNNILAVKEAMMKIIAGLVVQTKMNNGALNVVSQTNAFQQGINDSLKKFK